MKENNLNCKQAANYLKVSRQAIYLALSKKLLKGHRIQNGWTFSKDDLDDYISKKYNRDHRKVDGILLFDKNNLSVKQASTLSGYSIHQIYYLLRQGKIGSKRSGCTWIIPKHELSKFNLSYGELEKCL